MPNEQFLNRVLHGDCLEWLPQIEDNSIDMILCDLPYGTTKAKWDTVLPFEMLWKEYKRIIKETGAIVLTASQPFTSKLVISNLEWFKEELIWEKDRASNFANAKVRHLKYHENILIFAKGKYTYNRQMQPRKSDRVSQHQKSNYVEKSRLKKEDGTEIAFNTNYEGRSFEVYDAKVKNPSSVIYNPIVNPNGKEKVNHSTQKPLLLFEYLVKTYTNEGETVLDNCLGSGTTAVACINTNRNFIGIEREWVYCEIANKRINEAKTITR